MAQVRGLDDEELDGLAARIEALVTRILRRIARQVARLLGAGARDAGPAAVSPDDVAAIRVLWQQHLDAEVQPALRGAYRRAATVLAGKLAVLGHDLPALSALTADDYLAQARNRLVGIGDDVWTDVRAQLVAGMAAGEGVPQLAARVRNVAEVSEPRARTIARTETLAAANAAVIAQATLMGDTTVVKEWLATPGVDGFGCDIRTRPTHCAADGQRVKIGEPFQVGGARLRFPGDPVGPPDETINCRCSVAVDLDDEALTAAFGDFHLPGRHDQKTHGRKGLRIPDLPDLPVDGPGADRNAELRQQRVERIIERARKTHATDVTHAPDGVWEPERDRLHRQIAADLYTAASTVPTDGRAIIAGGLGGAGKSTVLRDHANVEPGDYFTINPDEIKEELARRGLIPEVPDAPDLSPMERVALVHEESSRIAHLMADMAYRDRRNLVWDITMSSESGIRSRVAALERHGYTDVAAVFVDIPVEVSVSRALTRYRRGVEAWDRGEGQGGRFVPPTVIRRQRTSAGRSVNREVFETMKGIFTDWSLYDNSEDGLAPQLIATRSAGTAPSREG